jgi:O-antigen/teichoic acid export membrane protein
VRRSFFRNAGLLAAAEIFVRLKGLIVIPLLTHRLGPDGYGVWAQVATIALLIGPVLILGTDSAVVRFLPGTDREERNRRFAGWMLGVAVLGGVVCVLVSLLREPLSVAMFGTAHEYARFVPLAAASIFATILLNFGRTWYRLENAAFALSMFTVAQAVGSAAAIGIWYLMHGALYGLVVLSVLADSLIGLAVVVLVLRQTGLVKPDLSIIPKYIRFGIVLVPAGYAVWALNWADRIFLVQYADLRAVGIYSLAYTLGFLAIQVLVNPIWTMFPNLMAELWNQGKREEAQELFASTSSAVIAVSLPAIVLAWVLGAGILRVLATDSFAAAAQVMPLVVAGYLLFMFSAFYEVTFALVGRQALAAVTVGIACVANIGLNFLLIPRYSYTGAAVATAVSFAIQLGVCLVINHRLKLLRLDGRVVVKLALAALATGVVMYPFRSAFDSHGALAVLAGGAIGGALYLVLCRLLGVLPPGLVQRELGLLTRRIREPRRRDTDTLEQVL